MLNPARLAALTDVRIGQQANMLRQMSKGEQMSKGKSKGDGKGKKGNERPQVPRYNGTDAECSICQANFQRDESVYRITCNHLFHEECWNTMLDLTTGECECPNCRGPATATSLFKCIGVQTDSSASDRDAARQFRDAARNAVREGSEHARNGRRMFVRPRFLPSSPPSSGGSFETVLMVDNWTTEQMNEWSNSWTLLPPAEYFRQGDRGNVITPSTNAEEVHLKEVSKTKLAGGRNSFVVDLGSRINIIGSNTEREFAAKTAAAGHPTTYFPRDRLHVNGVGSDSATCDREMEAPIAVKFEGQPATLQKFRANIAEGCGTNLPAILGATSMQEKDSVLILRSGKEMFVFPGPGGCSIKWSPGTKLLPMQHAPSGHLVVQCDRFEDLPVSTTPKAELSFWINNAHK